MSHNAKHNLDTSMAEETLPTPKEVHRIGTVVATALAKAGPVE